jgi:methionyl-tRNA formyltransferase
MRLIFAGTPPFAAAALSAIHAAGHEIALVLTQPDRPAGRGQKLTASAVAEKANKLGLALEKPATLKGADIQAQLVALKADVMVVVAYGLLLPRAVLDTPKYGCLNIHGSLLPRWRGAAPVQRAIEAGDAEAGIDIMQMDEGLDTGPVLLEKRVAIAPDETTTTLFAKLTDVAASAIVAALKNLNELVPRHQTSEGVLYAKKVEKIEGRIDWSQTASVIERRLRAFDPFPGCESVLVGETLKIWRGEVVRVAGRDVRAGLPGEVIAVDSAHVLVACGQDALSLHTVQKPGSKRVSIGEFLRASPIQTGVRFG